MDVNGTYKLGTKGNINKNQISFAATIPATTLGAATLIVLGIGYAPFASEYTFAIPTANSPTTTQATVSVSFGADLPASCGVAFARVIQSGSVFSVRLRLYNYASATVPIAATPVYFTITEF